MEAVTEYLSGTAYAEGGQAIAESSSAFERWCDNRMMQAMLAAEILSHFQ